MVYPPPTAQRCDHDRPRAPCPRLACSALENAMHVLEGPLRVKKVVPPSSSSVCGEATAAPVRRRGHHARLGRDHGMPGTPPTHHAVPSTRRTFSSLLL
jgi:hypothetical protein